jgi:aminoglycoside 3-N-acetyltransferase
VVHSSFRRLRRILDTPDEAIDAILECLGPAGDLVLPTFNYTSPLPEPCYDPEETPARTGIIVEIGRKRPEARRSLHPTHSVAVIGPHAEELTRGHLEGRALGIDSPLDRLARSGGKVLLLGVGHTSNSTIHVAEEHAGVPKVPLSDPLPRARVRRPDGSMIEHRLDPSPSCGIAFGGAEYVLRREGLIRDARAGSCRVQLMHGQDVIDRVGDLIRREPKVLLCTSQACERCRRTRRRIDQGGLRPGATAD